MLTTLRPLRRTRPCTDVECATGTRARTAQHNRSRTRTKEARWAKAAIFVCSCAETEALLCRGFRTAGRAEQGTSRAVEVRARSGQVQERAHVSPSRAERSGGRARVSGRCIQLVVSHAVAVHSRRVKFNSEIVQVSQSCPAPPQANWLTTSCCVPLVKLLAGPLHVCVAQLGEAACQSLSLRACSPTLTSDREVERICPTRWSWGTGPSIPSETSKKQDSSIAEQENGMGMEIHLCKNGDVSSEPTSLASKALSVHLDGWDSQ
eukprot:755106-Hanusia_phi.AAC.1